MKNLILSLTILLCASAALGRMGAIVVGGQSPGAPSQGFVGLNATPGSYYSGVIASANHGCSAVYSASASGNVSQVCVALDEIGGTDTLNVAIYNADGSTLLRDGAVTVFTYTPPGYQCVSLDSPLAITSGTSYTLAWTTNSGWAAQGETSSGSSYQGNVSITLGNTMPSSISGGSTRNSRTANMYAN